MLRVLLIDDSQVFLSALKELLNNFPMVEVVDATNDANTGVILASEHMPDIIFVDVNMPDKNGFAITESLLLLCPLTRIIIISLNDLPEYRDRTLAVGAASFVCKNDLAAMLPEIFSTAAPPRSIL